MVWGTPGIDLLGIKRTRAIGMDGCCNPGSAANFSGQLCPMGQKGMGLLSAGLCCDGSFAACQSPGGLHGAAQDPERLAKTFSDMPPTWHLGCELVNLHLCF